MGAGTIIAAVAAIGSAIATLFKWLDRYAFIPRQPPPDIQVRAFGAFVRSIESSAVSTLRRLAEHGARKV
jgi:hypothetical protein